MVASFYCFASAADAETLIVEPMVMVSATDDYYYHSNSALAFISELLVLESIDESVDDELVVKAKDPSTFLP